MNTREIPREQWVKFFDNFSRPHEGWIVTLEVDGSTLGAQQEADGLPLVGVTADLKSRENSIEISLGGRLDTHLTRIIESPTHVWSREPEEVGHEAIEVESEDGTTTILHFRHVPPDKVERLLPE